MPRIHKPLALLYCAFLTLALGAQGSVLGQANVPKSWLAVTDMYGNHLYQTLSLGLVGSALSGSLDGNALTGTLEGSKVHFVVRDSQSTTYVFSGSMKLNQITASLMVTEAATPNVHVEHAFSAKALEERPARPPKVIEFVPTTFSNQFSADIAPVLTIWPGDTIRTKTIDSGGVDEHGLTRALYGNPQTGPFFVGGAQAGDVLAVHFRSLRLNRDYADSLDAITERAKTSRLALKANNLVSRFDGCWTEKTVSPDPLTQQAISRTTLSRFILCWAVSVWRQPSDSHLSQVGKKVDMAATWTTTV